MDEKLINKLKQRGQNIWDTVSGKPVYGQESPALVDRALRVTGQLGGGTGDVMGSLLGLAGKGIGNVVEVLPEKVKKETPHRIAALKKKIGDIELPRTGETVREAKNDLVNVLKKSFEEMEKKKPHSTEAVEDIINTGDLVDLAIGAGIGKQIFKKSAQKELRTEALKKVLVPPGVKKTILGTAGGGAIGAQFGETPEERRKNALVGALFGGGAVNLKNIRKGLKGLGEAGQINVFHGSPHKFKEFDIAKIGTGEGAQAFGHGLYFTNEKDIAKGYAKNLSQGHVVKNMPGIPIAASDQIMYDIPEIAGDLTSKLRGKIFEVGTNDELAAFGEIAKSVKKNGSGIDEIVQKYHLNEIAEDFEKFANKNEKNLVSGFGNADNRLGEFGEYVAQQYLKTKDIRKVLEKPYSGFQYTVTLHKGKTPDQYDYLKWDEPTNKTSIIKIFNQAKKENNLEIKESMRNAIDAKPGSSLSDSYRVGGKLYRNLSNNLGSDKAASDFLLRAGIDGIDYPAGTFSDVKSNARNYVVFDPRAATIEAVE